MQQGVRPRGKLVEKGVHPRVQGRPVASQAMQAPHVRAQPAPQLLMTPILMHLLLSNTDKEAVHALDVIALLPSVSPYAPGAAFATRKARAIVSRRGWGSVCVRPRYPLRRCP